MAEAQPVTLEILYDAGGGADWHEAPAYVRDPVNWRHGAQSEGQESPPCSAGATLDNRTREWNPHNPASDLYGVTGRSTPVRMLVGGIPRVTVEASGWQPDQTVDGADAWTEVAGGGLTERLGLGKTVLRSALERAILAAGPASYWRLTDGAGSTQANNEVTDAPALLPSGVVNWAAAAGPAWSPDPSVDLLTSSRTRAGSLAGRGIIATTGGHVVDLVFRLVTDDTDTFSTFAEWRFDGSAGRAWTITGVWLTGSGGLLNLAFTRPDGSLTTINYGAGITPGQTEPFDGAWHHLRVSTLAVGADTVLAAWLDGVSIGGATRTGTEPGQINATLVGGIGDEFVPGVVSSSVRDLAVFDPAGTVPAVADQFSALGGHRGEAAGQRFLRIGDEAGIRVAVWGNPDDTQAMGPQPRDTLLNLLRECVRTDAGRLLEPRDEIGAIMRTGRDLYNQDPIVALDFTAQHVQPPLRPMLTTRPALNDVTARNRFGSSARVSLDTGRMSTLDPPDGAGRIDGAVDVNVADDASLPGVASWWLHLRTVDEPRWPGVNVDLTLADMDLLADTELVEVGDRFTVANVPDDWNPDGLSLLAFGIAEVVPSHTRRITLLGEPASVYEVAIVGADDGSVDLRGQVIDTDLAALAAAIDDSDTSLSVETLTGGVLWDTDADGWNVALHGGGMFIRIGGEIMRITNITGGSSPQTFTVVRSINGVAKAHAAGAPVHAAYPVNVGL